MPIRPELRRYYGRAWREYRVEVLGLADHRCSRCGGRAPHLNVAHLVHDPRNWMLVAVLCASCHARHDSAQRYAMTRRTRARRSGQLWLWQSVEWAPFASWMVPGRIVRAAQGRLFE